MKKFVLVPRVKTVGFAALETLKTVGFSAHIPEEYRLATVLALKLPEGLDDAKVRHQLRFDYDISVTGGLGETAGKIWRLGLMGENARPRHYLKLMEALLERVRRKRRKTSSRSWQKKLAEKPISQNR